MLSRVEVLKVNIEGIVISKERSDLVSEMNIVEEFLNGEFDVQIRVIMFHERIFLSFGMLNLRTSSS